MIRWPLLAFVFLPLVVGCGPVSAQDELPILRVGHVGHDHHVALFAACDLGKALSPSSGGAWLEARKPGQVYRLHGKNGPVAHVMLSKVRGGSGMPSALAAGEIDIGLGGVAPSATIVDSGARLRLIAPLNADGDMFMLRPDIRADSWAEFVQYAKTAPKPVRVGYKAPRAVARLIFEQALDEVKLRHGTTPVDARGERRHVVLVNLKGGKNMLPALASGTVEGIVMNQPTVAHAEARKLGKIVADLRELPPKGAWHTHPCCGVMATETVLQRHRAEVVTLLQPLVAAGRLIKNDTQKAISVATKWTRTSDAIEGQSIPTVTYVSEFDEDWQTGMHTWFRLMKQDAAFDGVFRSVSPAEATKRLTDFSLLQNATESMPAPGKKEE